MVKKIVLLGILVGWMGISATQGEGAIRSIEGNTQLSEWFFYPFSIQVNPNLSSISSTNILTTERLLGLGASIDLSLLYINQFFWKNLHGLPRIGLLGYYNSLKNKERSWETSIYLEPHYNPVADCEVTARLGAGLAQVNLPSQDIQHALCIDLSYTLVIHWHIASHWHIQLLPGIHYLCPFKYLSARDKPLADLQFGDTSLLLCNLGIGYGYTINPSNITYPSSLIHKKQKKNRFDIGFLFSKEKIDVVKEEIKSDQDEIEIEEEDTSHKKTENYYTLGIYGHWSLRYLNYHAFTLSSELEYSEALAESTKKVHPADIRKIRVKAFIGHEFLWNKLIFEQAIGLRMLYHTKNIDSLYAKLGLSYHITDHISVGLYPQLLLKLKRVQPFLERIDLKIGYSFY